MMPNKTYELRNLYFQQSDYSAKQEEEKYDQPSLIQCPTNGYFDTLKVDADLLQKALSPLTDYRAASLSEQVFGNELKGQKINLQHGANLFHERCQLNKRHLEDIDHRNMQVQEKLYGVWINNVPDRNKRLGNLESQLLQLEQQRREEELAFWKDTVDLRQQLFETATDYRNNQHRYNIFSDVEKHYG